MGRRQTIRPKKGDLLRARKRVYGFLNGRSVTIQPETVVMFLEKEKLTYSSSTRRYQVLHDGRIVTLFFIYYERISDSLEKIKQ